MKRARKCLAAAGGCLAMLISTTTYAGMLDFGFSAGNFTHPTALTNDFWGLRLGGPASAVFYSESADGCEVDESTVTGSTGNGLFADPYDIDAVAVHDRAWLSDDCDGQYRLMEDTTDWFAQDDGGNVWYMGEDTTAWDDDQQCLSKFGSWKAGNDGAEPGVIMLADPQPGDAYLQEYYEGQAEDRAKVLRLNAPVSVGFGDYQECLQTKEYSPLEPGAVEHKYYCRLSQGGVGLTLVNELKGKTLHVEYTGTTRPNGNYASGFPGISACAE